PTTIYTLSLHDALPIYPGYPLLPQRKPFVPPSRDLRTALGVRGEAAGERHEDARLAGNVGTEIPRVAAEIDRAPRDLVDVREPADRKSTRLNSSHLGIS